VEVETARRSTVERAFVQMDDDDDDDVLLGGRNKGRPNENKKSK
jgi:hypothetical protein